MRHIFIVNKHIYIIGIKFKFRLQDQPVLIGADIWDIAPDRKGEDVKSLCAGHVAVDHQDQP